MLTIQYYFGLAYVYRELTEQDTLRYIGNGYIPPTREREHDPNVYQYARGKLPPHFPVPAIPIRVGYMPADSTQPIAPCAYWYVSSDRLLWSIWKYEGLGNITMTIEYADTDDIEIRTI